MILVYQDSRKVTSVETLCESFKPLFRSEIICDVLFELAQNHPDQLIIWCHDDCKNLLDVASIQDIFTHNNMLASYNPTSNFLPESIGYVEESSFIKVNKSVRFPTWRMSSLVGGIHASTLNLKSVKKLRSISFDYFLNSVAKLGMPNGLRCYSDPRFLNGKASVVTRSASTAQLFEFVGQHYKKSWVFLMLLNFILYQKKYPIWSAIRSLFYARRRLSFIELSTIPIQGHTEMPLEKTIDVLIPTIGRESYLLDFLNDLKSQTLLPKRIIIVEQNPLEGSESALEYLYDRQWPFAIKHIFIHQSGVCNARNLALRELKNDWVFLADDDIRIESDFLERAMNQIYENGNQVNNICCLQKGQKSEVKIVHQTTIFGSGCSIVSVKSIGDSTFNTAFEFGFGEDSDFGCQLMNKGYSIEYLPKPIILHLKAPMGGFRIKPVHAWAADSIQPKPSPTVMLFKMKNHTKEQLQGYKIILFFKYYPLQSIRNPIRYFKSMSKQWSRSVFYAQWSLNNRR